MLKHVDGLGHELYYPLYSSLIVCYTRPFTNNKPYGSLGIKWYTSEDNSHNEMHRKPLTARHELIAHSDLIVNKAGLLNEHINT